MKKILIMLLAASISFGTAASVSRPTFKVPSKREMRRNYKSYLKSGDYYVLTQTTIKLMRRDSNTPKGLKSRNNVVVLRQLPQELDSVSKKTNNAYVHL